MMKAPEILKEITKILKDQEAASKYRKKYVRRFQIFLGLIFLGMVAASVIENKYSNNKNGEDPKTELCWNGTRYIWCEPGEKIFGWDLKKD